MKLTCALSVFAVLAAFAPAPAAAGQDLFPEVAGVRELSGRLVVRPRAGAGPEAAARLDPWRVRRHADIDEHVIQVPAGMTESELARQLLATADYAYVEPDWRVFAVGTPNDPELPLQWHLPKIDAPIAWDVTTGSPSVVIAVCDSGVDLDHPDLAAALVPGYNAVDGLPQAEGGQVDGLTDHGSAVAGSAAAVGNNGVGVTGVGWSLSIMPVRVSNLPNDSALISDINSGARWAASNGARIVNASFSGATTESVQASGEFIRDLGGIYVWAAGNAASSLGSADPANVLVVSATDQSDAPAVFTNFGAAVDLAAPGVDIRTTGLGGGSITIDGTSFSSPIVAGVLGLVLSVNPDLSAQAMETIVLLTADDLGDTGEDHVFGHGRVDAGAAAQLALDALTEPLAPIAFDDEGFAIDGAPLLLDVLANDVDLNGDPITIAGFDATTANGGMVELVAAPGGPFLEYTPAPGFEGLDSFQYTIEDEGGLTGTATVVVGAAMVPDLVEPPIELDHQLFATGQQLLIADIDGDGDRDIVAGYFSASFPAQFYENTAGTFTDAGQLPLSGTPDYLTVGDIDGDGCDDLAYSDQFTNHFGVLLGNCDFTFGEPITTAVQMPVAVVASDPDGAPLDFDGDGNADVAVALNGFQNHKTAILLGDGTGSFELADEFETIDVPNIVAGADVTGDGHLDVIMGGAGFGDLWVLPTDGAGQFVEPAAQVYGTGSNVADITLSDVDGNGHLDIVTVSSGPFGLPGARVLLADGNGAFEQPVLVHSGGEFPRGVAAADLDLDGDGDIMTANMLSNSVTVQPGITPGTFAPVAGVLDTETGPVDVVAHDFDGDGDADVAALLLTTIVPGTQRVLLWENPADPEPVDPADVDGDGVVNVSDLVAVILAWGQSGGSEDVDGSGTVDVGDLIAVILAWG